MNAQLPAACSEMCASFRYSGSLSSVRPSVRHPPVRQSVSPSVRQSPLQKTSRYASNIHVVHDLGQEHAVAQILQRRHLHVRRQLVLEALRLRPSGQSAARPSAPERRAPPPPPSLPFPRRTYPQQQTAQLRVVHGCSPAAPHTKTQPATSSPCSSPSALRPGASLAATDRSRRRPAASSFPSVGALGET